MISGVWYPAMPCGSARLRIRTDSGVIGEKRPAKEPISPISASMTELYPVDLPRGRESAATMPRAGTQPGPMAAITTPMR